MDMHLVVRGDSCKTWCRIAPGLKTEVVMAGAQAKPMPLSLMAIASLITLIGLQAVVIAIVRLASGELLLSASMLGVAIGPGLVLTYAAYWNQHRKGDNAHGICVRCNSWAAADEQVCPGCQHRLPTGRARRFQAGTFVFGEILVLIVMFGAAIGGSAGARGALLLSLIPLAGIVFCLAELGFAAFERRTRTLVQPWMHLLPILGSALVLSPLLQITELFLPISL